MSAKPSRIGCVVGIFDLAMSNASWYAFWEFSTAAVCYLQWRIKREWKKKRKKYCKYINRDVHIWKLYKLSGKHNKSSGFLRRPKNFGVIFQLDLTVTSNLSGKVTSNFWGLLRKPELYKVILTNFCFECSFETKINVIKPSQVYHFSMTISSLDPKTNSKFPFTIFSL